MNAADKNESLGHALRYQSAIQGRANLQGVGARNLLPGSARNLQRFVRNVPAQNLFRLFKTDGHVHDGVTLCFLRQSRNLSCPVYPRKRTFAGGADIVCVISWAT